MHMLLQEPKSAENGVGPGGTSLLIGMNLASSVPCPPCCGARKAVQQVDAVMWAFIQVVEAEWSGTTARWDGTTGSVKSRGRQMKEALPFAMMGVSVSYPGSVGALSLIVTRRRLPKHRPYNNRGGIQVIVRFLRGGPIPVPASEILANKERNAASVDIALNPVIGKPPTEVER